jgi:type IX secretion system substrate protein
VDIFIIPKNPNIVKNYLKILSAIFLLSCCSLPIHGQNLIVNPSAETGPPTSTGWTAVSIGTTGSTCYNSSGWRIIQSLNGFPAAQSGSYYFYPGCSSATGSTFELRQDIDVSINGGVIDNGWDAFTFSGYMQVYTQTPPDQSQMIVEYRNSTNTTVLTSYNTGLKSNEGTWTNYFKTTTAPVGTRWIRIRLLGVVNTGPSVDTYFDNLSLTTNIALPINLTAFNAIPQNSVVKITWTTSSETSNNYYTVQRSQDGTQWQDIEKVNGAGNTSLVHNYSAYDNNPFQGVSYYRIKQTDYNGTATYSEIKLVDFTKRFTDITIFPNPAQNFFTVEGNNVKNAQVTIYNSIGQLINLPASIQDNGIMFNTSLAPKGIYFVRINNGSGTEVKKVMID